MLENKYAGKIAVFLMLAVTALVVWWAAAGYGGNTAGQTMEYEERLFSSAEIISVDILMSEADWQEMLANATSEQYYQCDVVVNGETFYQVGIRPKGNTSLTTIAADPTTDRYSLKLEFDHFVDGQTCWGLDKLILNNNYADATNMKEAIVYDMYAFLGGDASLYNYAKISVNGEYWGCYLALEAVEDSFLLRNYGSIGALYKPDSMQIGGKPADVDGKLQKPTPSEQPPGDMRQAGPPQLPDSEQNTPQTAPPEPPDKTVGGGVQIEESPVEPGAGRRPELPGNGGGFGSGNNGSALNYTDDNLDSYSDIWDGAVTDTDTNDHRRVVQALKNISGGQDLSSYLDVDNVLKYLAVHTFAVNLDSLTGSMAHNYYLYESGGRLNLLPWDYNLAFGGFGQGGRGGKSDAASDLINFPIDSPLGNTDWSERQFFAELLADEDYLEQYHEYYRQLVEEYVFGGEFDRTYQRLRSQIDELVVTDPTAFYSAEEYEAAADMLYDTVRLRAQSIRGQLNGTIPATAAAQAAASELLLEAAGIDTQAMGVMNMNHEQEPPEGEQAPPGAGIDFEGNPPPEPPSGEAGGSGGEPEPPDGGAVDGAVPEIPGSGSAGGGEPAQLPDGSTGGSEQMTAIDGGAPPSMAPGTAEESAAPGWLVLLGCLLLLALAAVFVKFYRRRDLY